MSQLTGEMLGLVRNGAAPVQPRDCYYDLVNASLDKCSLLTHAVLMEAIRRAQTYRIDYSFGS
jgi:hypothetical protein